MNAIQPIPPYRLERSEVWEGHAFVAGEWIARADVVAVEDPATARIIGHVAALTVADVDRAVAAAAAAFPA